MLENMASKHMGDPLSLGTEVGPQARADLRDELHQQVQRSVELGAKCLLGGNIPAGNNALYPPTLLTQVTKGMPAFDEDPVLLVAMTPSAVAVVDPELTVPFAVADEASFTAAEELADAVPSMMVDNPTVIAPRLDEPDASDALELLSREVGPVGDGSADGANPVEPTSGEGERVERISVSVAVGETA